MCECLSLITHPPRAQTCCAKNSCKYVQQVKWHICSYRGENCCSCCHKWVFFTFLIFMPESFLPSLCLSQSVTLSLSLSHHLPMYVSITINIYLDICLFVHSYLSIYLSICMMKWYVACNAFGKSVCLSIYLSAYCTFELRQIPYMQYNLKFHVF